MMRVLEKVCRYFWWLLVVGIGEPIVLCQATGRQESRNSRFPTVVT